MALFSRNPSAIADGLSQRIHSIVISDFTSIHILTILWRTCQGALAVIHRAALDFCGENVINAW